MTNRTTVSLIATTLVVALGAGVALADRGHEGRGGDRQGMMEHHGEYRMARGEHGDRHGRMGERGDMMRGAGMRQMMEAYDTDGDGSLTRDEVLAARAAQLQKFDADGDGVLSLEEYQALWLDAMRERMVDRFQAHDDDGSGTVTVEEFNEEFERMIERADRNGDGILNQDDFGRAGTRGPRQGMRGGMMGTDSSDDDDE